MLWILWIPKCVFPYSFGIGMKMYIIYLQRHIDVLLVCKEVNIKWLIIFKFDLTCFCGFYFFVFVIFLSYCFEFEEDLLFCYTLSKNTLTLCLIFSPSYVNDSLSHLCLFDAQYTIRSKPIDKQPSAHPVSLLWSNFARWLELFWLLLMVVMVCL